MIIEYLQLAGHDAFLYGGGLNKSGAEIYWFLLSEPMTAKDLSERTGRSRRTVFRGLSRMVKLVDSVTGESIPMVEKEGDYWRACEKVDLDHIARIVGTSGAGIRKKMKHREERRAYIRELKFGRLKEEINSST